MCLNLPRDDLLCTLHDQWQLKNKNKKCSAIAYMQWLCNLNSIHNAICNCMLQFPQSPLYYSGDRTGETYYKYGFCKLSSIWEFQLSFRHTIQENWTNNLKTHYQRKYTAVLLKSPLSVRIQKFTANFFIDHSSVLPRIFNIWLSSRPSLTFIHPVLLDISLGLKK